MKQTKYNYRGRPQGSYMSYRAELEILDDTPTHKQKAFYGNLIKRLRDHGIDPFEHQEQRPFTRAMYAGEIDRLIALCEKNGIYQRKKCAKTPNFERTLVVEEDNFKDNDIRVNDRIMVVPEINQSAPRVMSPIVPLEIYKIELLLQGRDFGSVRSMPRGQKDRLLTEYHIKLNERTKKYVACIEEIWNILASKFPEGAAEYKNFTVCTYTVKNGVKPKNGASTSKKEALCNA